MGVIVSCLCVCMCMYVCGLGACADQDLCCGNYTRIILLRECEYIEREERDCERKRGERLREKERSERECVIDRKMIIRYQMNEPM